MKAQFAISYIFASILAVSIMQIECSDSNVNAEAKNSNATAILEKKPVYNTPFIPTVELSWKNEIGQLLAVGGLVVSGLVIIGAFVWLLGPIFGYKMCTLLGTCEPESIPYQNGGNLNLPEYGQAHVFANNPYASSYGQYYDSQNKKRSLNYLGPIIKTLASAYEKYDSSATAPPKQE